MATIPTDASLLRESRRRPDAFVEVCERHADVLLGWLRARTRNEDTSAELLAETFAEAWKSRHRYRDPGSGSARPWLFGIARNLLMRYRRDGAVEARARRRLGLPLHAPEPFDEVDARLGSDERLAVAAAVAELPQEQQQALRLRVVEEREYKEIAARLRISPATARTRVFRALGSLRTRLEGGQR